MIKKWNYLGDIKGMLKAFFLIVDFFSSQGIVRVIDLAVVLIVLRLLTIQEYALYTISSFLLIFGSIASDMCISHAMIPLGSKVKSDSQRFNALFATARRYNIFLYFVTTPAVILLTLIMTRGHDWDLKEIFLCGIFILLSNWFQQIITLRNSILYIHQDSKGLFKSRMSASVLRLLLTLTLCKQFPTAPVVLFINMAGLFVNNFVLSITCKNYLHSYAKASIEEGEKLKQFIYPLIPVTIYFLFHSQIVTFLLSIFGQTASIAQIGALGRLGLIISFLELINPFFIQPYFSVLNTKKQFITSSLVVIMIVLFFGSLLFASSFIFPGIWLFILGDNYSNLYRELPLLIATSLLTLIYSVMYSMFLSRATTRGQTIRIFLDLCIILFFVFLHGVRSAYDGILLNLVLEGANLVFQFILLARVLYLWR